MMHSLAWVYHFWYLELTSRLVFFMPQLSLHTWKFIMYLIRVGSLKMVVGGGKFSRWVMSHSCDPVGCSSPSACPQVFPGKDTEVGYHFLLQGIFLTQGWNLRLLLAGGFFTDEPPGKPWDVTVTIDQGWSFEELSLGGDFTDFAFFLGFACLEKHRFSLLCLYLYLLK